jgi:predicted O-linked N-acetylglucosamine transferase (SPINDLY family)
MNRSKKNKSIVSKSYNDQLVAAIKLQQQGMLTEAETLFRQILRIIPTNPHALYSLSVILFNSGQYEEALRLAEKGVIANPDFFHLWYAKGSVLQALQKWDEALFCFNRALEINPNYISALVSGGAALYEMLRPQEALIYFQRALAIDPECEKALGNAGIILSEHMQTPQAAAAFQRLLQKNPDYPYGWGLLCYERMFMCDWRDFDVMSRVISTGIRDRKAVSKTLALMALSDSAEEHFRCAQIFAQKQYPLRPEPLWSGEHYLHKRIKVAYVSPDLREHPVGHLMAGVIEAHDKTQFETIAFSLGANDNSRIHTRMVASFDHFIEAKNMNPRQIAELMRQMEVDIAIDLAGYTTGARIEIFLNRPAPVQVNYLGYPGTMALDCYDYIVADRTVIPEEHQAYYSEKVAYLDQCYLPTATGIKVGEALHRNFYGLPEHGFVFCAFSHDYKVHPEMFSVWMRLLESNPGSVLWLMSRNESTQNNLRQEALHHSIDPARLVFASRVPNIEDHLARYRVADLFLDTWPYNAHTTAADALMAGLPVVTFMGNSFPSRVAASLLNDFGLSHLVTTSRDQYFDLVNGLAHDSQRLQRLKENLTVTNQRRNVMSAPPFARALEGLYVKLISVRSR